MEPSDQPGSAESRPGVRPSMGWVWRLGGLLAAGVVVMMLTRSVALQEMLQVALDRIARMGAWGPVLFIASYGVASILFIPGSVLTLGAGAVFGVAGGTVCASVGSTLGATAAFLVARHLAREAVTRRLQGHPRLLAIEQAVVDEGWKIVLLTRLSPVFPFVLLNYAFGLTRVRLSHYVVASWVGMLPATVMYVYLGSLARVASGERSRTPAEWAWYGVGLVAAIAVTFYVTRLARRALAVRRV